MFQLKKQKKKITEIGNFSEIVIRDSIPYISKYLLFFTIYCNAFI